MPRTSTSSRSRRGRGGATAGDGGSGKRYAATVEKGENAWRREWSSFMSGVNLKRLRDGTSGVSLKASADIERQLETSPTATAAASSPHGRSARGSGGGAGDVGVNGDGIPLNAGAASASFSYLFSSPAERRAEREASERADKERRRAEKLERMAKSDPLSVLSKHQRALHDATQRGLQLEGMNRKARRDFLHLTVSEAAQKAEEQSREFKLHDLMDEKLAWYQQGPHPVDLIAEKLVRRKAEKKAKQLGLKYNYLAPHASWLAKRAQRRREGLLVGLGKRLVFNEEKADEAGGGGGGDTTVMTVTDPLRQRTVPLCEMRLLLTPTTVIPVAAADEEAAAAAPAMQKDSDSDDENAEKTQHKNGNSNDDDGNAKGKGKTPDGHNDERDKKSSGTGSVAAAARLPDVGVLQDPSHLTTSFVRRVVRDRATAVAIQQMNRTTTFLSSDLVNGPSLTPEDTSLAKGLPSHALTRSTAVSASSAGKPKRPTRAPAAPSFSPYATPVFEDETGDAQSASAASDVASAPPERRKRVRTHGDNDNDDDGSEGEAAPSRRKKEDMRKTTKEPKAMKAAHTKKSSSLLPSAAATGKARASERSSKAKK
ncbi:hypothetical protein ABB37_07777 [Leptomonas pyrrhocoris]|uniref:Uncharacterized protein n=1 Tax=Leptomonas pyrrhocoris TaxID=157538 RepID=A0A0M9FUX2_LEPPY|nr:hypothetical protein ABB37_07777 [Leptomonas pyrrhocoris]KPA76457.1 hypothetical protein ABB37_07777 [Leptomonas pyrrhocoris]|eukprot:XP_015654896.1 hypothetical protein ABB37_07777 [Leptomonas pyrrhocoris]